jgi:uncharacterized integral membrane protein
MMGRDRDEPGDGVADSASGRSFLGNVRLWGGLGAGALLILFLVQNLQKVEVNFLWMSYEIQMIFALLIAAGLGALTFFFLGVLRRRARRKERREDRRN